MPGCPVMARCSGRKSAAEAFNCRLPVGASLAAQMQRALDRCGKTAGGGKAVDAEGRHSSGPLAEIVIWPGQLIDRETRSRSSSRTSAPPSSASSRLLTRSDGRSRMRRLPVASPLSVRRSRSQGRRRGRAWRLVRALPARSIVRTPCTFAGARRSANGRNESATCGANRPTILVRPASVVASTSSVRRPRGCDDSSSMRPLMSSAAPPRSPIESRSMCNMPASNLTLALTARASTPANVALPTSRTSAT